MQFSHSTELRQRFPELHAGVLVAEGLHAQAQVAERIAHYGAIAQARLAAANEGEFPEIQAWRRAFSSLGLKPTQYRCASESLLRRFRKEGALPRLHPLVDLCNSISLAFAIPVAVLDRARIEGDLQVRPAAGSETYEGFAGEVEHPEPGEVTFVDAAGRAHARRWTHRQSGYSAVSGSTRSVLIVAEGLHSSAAADVGALVSAIACELEMAWGVQVRSAVLTGTAPALTVQ